MTVKMTEKVDFQNHYIMGKKGQRLLSTFVSLSVSVSSSPMLSRISQILKCLWEIEHITYNEFLNV